MILEILFILLGWWKVGGFDWITDVINCIFYVDYNYLETIANLITENDRLRDENNGLEEQLRFKKLDYTKKLIKKFNKILNITSDSNLDLENYENFDYFLDDDDDDDHFSY